MWLVLLATLFFYHGSMTAQTTEGWEEVYQSVFDISDEEETEWEDIYDHLQPLAENPINLNETTREQLEQLPFLSAQQVMDLMEYLDRYGPMRSLGELRMVASLDYQQIALLPFFVYIDTKSDQQPAFPSLGDILKDGRHTLTAYTRVPFYTRKGDENGYLGYRYRHWVKYEFKHRDNVRLGLLGSQDAGEPFLANRNRLGYDNYTYFLQVKGLGAIDNMVVGKFKLSAGMGLALGQSFSLGKMVALQNLGRQLQTLRPHGSRSTADYFQGAGATLRLSRHLKTTLFASYRPVDATLNDDGTAATLVYSGYHRTESEMQKKNNTHLTSGGATVDFRWEGFRVGAQAVYTHIDRQLMPNTQTLYRRHYASGTNFLNASLSYGWTHPRMALSGETAIDGHGHLATINTASYTPSSNLALVALQRFYSYRYASLHAHSFSDGGRVQNESGVYMGVRWNPLAHWSLQSYVDYAYFPWARYLVSQSSHSWDLLLQASYHRKRLTVEGRYRGRLRQRDNEEKTLLVENNTHRGRLFVEYVLPTGWNLRTQVDLARAFYLEASNGWAVSQRVGYESQRIKGQLSVSYFNTDSYQSRIYVYERQLAGNFGFPSYYGEGIHMALSGLVDINDHLRLSAKVGYTNYFDRHTIGTALQQIDASHATDLDLQLRWKF